MRYLSFYLMLCAVALHSLGAEQSSGVIGDWTEPSGSTIRIEFCGKDLCARLIAVSKQAPTRFDIHNPDPASKGRQLCGLEIGGGFHLSADQTHAEGGFLYDPKSGKTYRGSMTSYADRLELRGYIGIKLFGRSEVWTRSRTKPSVCAPS